MSAHLKCDNMTAGYYTFQNCDSDLDLLQTRKKCNFLYQICLFETPKISEQIFDSTNLRLTKKSAIGINILCLKESLVYFCSSSHYDNETDGTQLYNLATTVSWNIVQEGKFDLFHSFCSFTDRFHGIDWRVSFLGILFPEFQPWNSGLFIFSFIRHK